MGLISRAAFEVDDYWRIVDILHQRLSRFERKNWRFSYKALILLEHLLTHGPESVAGEFQTDEDVIRETESFQYIDERGFNWGLTVRKKSKRVLKLLEKGALLKEERDQARKLTRGIEGFGSFSHRSSSTEATSFRDSSLKMYERSHSDYNDHGDTSQFSLHYSDEDQMIKKQLDTYSRTSPQENKAPTEELDPIFLFPYPNGLARPAFSFSDCGKEKNFTASDSTLEMNTIGIPWLTTLKNPKSLQALTIRVLASGFERFITGIPDTKVEVLQSFTKENVSNAGFEQTTMAEMAKKKQSSLTEEEKSKLQSLNGQGGGGCCCCGCGDFSRWNRV